MGERNVIWISFLFVVYYLIAGIVLTNIVVAVYINMYLHGIRACRHAQRARIRTYMACMHTCICKHT